MSFEPTNNPCPCESGLEYPYCCGGADRNELNILGDIHNDGQITGKLPSGLKEAVTVLLSSPDLYPAKLDLIENRVQFVKMSAYWYSESIFLDAGRILGTCGLNSSADWLWKKTEHIPLKATPIIFHTAFCGSTLLSKGLDVIYHCLPVREPESLNNLLVYLYSQASDCEKEGWTQRILGLLGRRYEANSPAVIKTSDYSNGLLKTILVNYPDTPILFMYTSLAEFFSSCIKVESRQIWVRDRYLSVAGRISEVIPKFKRDEVDENSIGQLSAIYWSYNMALYYNALDFVSTANANHKLCSLNFSDFLKNPLNTMNACAKWFDLDAQQGVNAADEIKWMLGVYSKDIAHEYSPQKRNEDIIEVLKANVTELVVAETLAKQLLAEKYPEKGLPSSL